MRRRIKQLVGSIREWIGGAPKLRLFVPVLVRALVKPRQSVRVIAPVPDTRPRTRRPNTGQATSAVAFSIIRNGIANGYPFVEAYGSWLDFCSRLVILDGESNDGTREALDALAQIDDRVVVESARWPESVVGGSAIAEFTNRALELARREADATLVYLQADEIYPREHRELAARPRRTALEFAGCVNFWNSFDTVVANEFPMRYVRAFPADSSIRSIADGFSFELGSLEVEHSSLEILHYGWCFPVNILRKHVSHARLYRDNPVYRARGAVAAAMLRDGTTERRLLDALAPGYRPTAYRGEHPPAMRHVIEMTAYDPEPGLDLLERGAVW